MHLAPAPAGAGALARAALALALLATPATASQEPLHADANIDAADPAADPYGTTPATPLPMPPPPLAYHPPPPAAHASDSWECTLGAWVRAPDLAPNTRVRGEARLVANGSACDEIVGWGVGLRFLERAVLRRKKDGASTAADPTQTHVPHERVYASDSVDAFAVGDAYDAFDAAGMGGMPAEMSPYYHNPGQWETHGAERVVFDTAHALPFEPGMWLDDGRQWLDGVAAFAVHVPNTNFPPLTASSGMGWGMRAPYEVGGTTGVEDLCEYYITVTRANGVEVHVPAGKAGFIPAAEPTAAIAAATATAEADAEVDAEAEAAWPKTYAFRSPRRDEKLKYRPGPPQQVPDCDKDGLAEFSISVDYPSPEPIVQGKNITLHATLTRTGNGSEVPHSMFFTHTTDETYTWARALVSSDDEYDRLEVENKGAGLPPWVSEQSLQLMLAATPQAVIDREAARQRPPCGPRGYHPLSWEERTVTHVFDADTTDLTAEHIEFEIELPIGYNDMPTFDRTFHALRSTLSMSLQTRFTCAHAPVREFALPEPTSAAEAAVRARNNAWQEHVPPREAPTYDHSHNPPFAHWGQRQLGVMPLDVRSPLPAAGKALSLRHYMDPAALAPKITLEDETKVEYAPVGSELRPETERERVRQRYARTRPCREVCAADGERTYGARCRALSCGGENKHAAKVWAYDYARRHGLEAWVRDETMFQDPPIWF